MATGFPRQHAQQATRRSRMVLHDPPSPANNGLPTTTEPAPIIPAPPPKPKCLPPFSGVDKSLLTHYAEYPEAEFALLSRTLRSQAFALQTDLLDQTTRKQDREALDVLRLRDIANNLTSVQPDPETGAADLQAYRRTIAGKGGLGVYLIRAAGRHSGLVGLAEELLRVAVVKGRLGRGEVARAWREVRRMDGGRGSLDPRGAEMIGGRNGGEGGVVGAGDWMAGVGLDGGLVMANDGTSGQFNGQPMGQGVDANGGVNMTGFGAGNEIPAYNGGMLNLPNGQPVGLGMNEGRGIVRHGYPTPEDDMHDQLSGQPVGPGMNVPVGSHVNGAPMYNGGMFYQSNGQPVAQGMRMSFGNGVSGYPTPNANTPGQMDGHLVAPGMATFSGMQYPTANGGMVVQPGQQPVVSGMSVAPESHDPVANGGMVMLPEQQPVGLGTPVFAGNQYSTGDGNMARQPNQQPYDQDMVAEAGNDTLDPNGTSTTEMSDPVDCGPVGPNADFLLYDNTQVEEQLPSEMMAGQPDNATGSDDVMFGLTNYSAYERSQDFESIAMESELQDAGEEKAESDSLDGLDVDQLIDQRAVLNRWGAHLGDMV